MSAAEPWGYLLPLRDGPAPLELRQDAATAGTAPSCTLLVDAATSGLPAGAPPPLLFSLRRDAASGSPVLRSAADVVWVDDQQVRRGRKRTLQHGARIAFQPGVPTYVYVDRKESDNFTAPQDVLDEYLVGHCLGKGGFGTVYIVFHKKQNYRRNAMKIVHPKNETELRYARRESRILLSLNHPCVIKSFSIGQLEEVQFLVMEYMGGGDLDQFLNNKRLLSEQQTKLIFFQVSLAVEYLHAHSICHRDLKPGNILLQRRDPNSLIKLTDFGLSKKENDDSIMKTLAGSREYLAPEIINDDTYTQLIDVWNMGVILFYCLSGYRPFKNINEIRRRGHRIKFDGVRWNGVSLQARNLVTNMLKKKAADRLSVTQVINHPWLSDPEMRENAYRLMGLEENQLRRIPDIYNDAQETRRPLSLPRENSCVSIPLPDYSDEDDESIKACPSSSLSAIAPPSNTPPTQSDQVVQVPIPDPDYSVTELQCTQPRRSSVSASSSRSISLSRQDFEVTIPKPDYPERDTELTYPRRITNLSAATSTSWISQVQSRRYSEEHIPSGELEFTPPRRASWQGVLPVATSEVSMFSQSPRQVFKVFEENQNSFIPNRGFFKRYCPTCTFI